MLNISCCWSKKLNKKCHKSSLPTQPSLSCVYLYWCRAIDLYNWTKFCISFLTYWFCWLENDECLISLHPWPPLSELIVSIRNKLHTLQRIWYHLAQFQEIYCLSKNHCRIRFPTYQIQRPVDCWTELETWVLCEISGHRH